MKILAISGSLRADSYNTALARAAVELAPPGVDVELYEGLADIPPYDADRDGEDTPEPVRDLRERIAVADALLVVTPEYNGSIPGVLKNAIDWASRPPAGPDSVLWEDGRDRRSDDRAVRRDLGAAGPSPQVLGIAGARVIDGEVPVAHAQNVFDGSGRLLDPLVAERLRDHVVALVHDAAPALIAA